MSVDEAALAGEPAPRTGRRRRSPAALDGLFLVGLGTLLASYLVLIAGLLAALGSFTTGAISWRPFAASRSVSP